MQVRGLDFVGVAVSCMAAAREFYGDILGLRPVGEFADSWAECDAGNVTLSLIEADAGAVPDVAAAAAELRRKGVRITTETTEFPPCCMATLQDPSGDWVWLHQRKDGTAG